jgi:hypothetical protein
VALGVSVVLTLDPERFPCVVHSYHAPRAETNHAHHVVPLSWTDAIGAPEGRTVSICPTGHDNVHVAIRKLLNGRVPPRLGPRSQALVDEAIEWWTTRSLAHRSLIMALPE